MAAYTPRARYITATDVAASVTFATAMGSFTIQNTDTANKVYFAFDTVAVNTPNTNDVFELAAGQPLSFNRAQFTTISFICAAGLTARVVIYGTQGEQA